MGGDRRNSGSVGEDEGKRGVERWGGTSWARRR